MFMLKKPLDTMLSTPIYNNAAKRGLYYLLKTLCINTFFTKPSTFEKYAKGHITKVYSILGGGLENLHGFRLIGVRCFVLVCIQLNPIRRNPCKFFSPPP